VSIKTSGRAIECAPLAYQTCQIDREKSRLLRNQAAFLIGQASGQDSSQDSGFTMYWVHTQHPGRRCGDSILCVID
jgi:hypothetical protein